MLRDFLHLILQTGAFHVQRGKINTLCKKKKNLIQENETCILCMRIFADNSLKFIESSITSNITRLHVKANQLHLYASISQQCKQRDANPSWLVRNQNAENYSHKIRFPNKSQALKELANSSIPKIWP